MGLEWLALHLSPVFYGLDVPRGDQSAVIVVPGFLATDHYLFELHAVASLQQCFPPTIKQTAIFTKSDGVVDWRVCVHDDPASNFEVATTHIGLAFDAETYGVIARRLAEH